MGFQIEEEIIPLSNGESFLFDIKEAEAKEEKSAKEFKHIRKADIEEIIEVKDSLVKISNKPVKEAIVKEKPAAKPAVEKKVMPSSDAELFGIYSENFNDLKENTIVKGRVVDITEDSVLVDIGYKSDGVIPIEDLKGQKLKNGDEIEVYIIKIEDESGIIQISKNKVDVIRVRDKIKNAYYNNQPIVGKITKKIKGGFTVDIGLEAFLPLSQISTKRQTKFDKYFGKEYEFKIIEFDENKKNIVVSRRILLEERRELERAKFLEEKKVGDIVEGTVRNILNYGAFIELECIDAFLPIQEISWGRVENIIDYFKVDDKIKCIILNIDKSTKKIRVGLKQLTKDPWTVVDEKYGVNKIVDGRVESVNKFGVFVELEPGLVGLAPISELSWSMVDFKKIDEIVKKDDVIKCRILNIDKANKRILLSVKKVSVNPWELFLSKHKTGDIVSGTIVNIINNAAFAKIYDGVEGIINKEDIFWDKRVNNVYDVLNIGETVMAKILEINAEKRKLVLGLKQVEPDPWHKKLENYKIGSIVKGTVVSITNFGIFVKIPNGIEGLIHKSQIPKEKSSDLAKNFKLGEELDIEITNIDFEKHKIGFSITKYMETMEQKELDDYLNTQESGEVTLGSLINLDSLIKK